LIKSTSFIYIDRSLPIWSIEIHGYASREVKVSIEGGKNFCARMHVYTIFKPQK